MSQNPEINAQIGSIPDLKRQPSYNELCLALKGLKVSPNSWTDLAEEEHTSTLDSKAVSQFLISVVRSNLDWQTEDQKEEIYQLASKRISERCGRSAMPEMTRTWTIPASDQHPELRFEIREPRITEDNLGFKTWGTAFAISKLLETLGQQYFDHVPRNCTATPESALTTQANAPVLELGSGTGLVGISLAAIWNVDVILTDLPEIQENLCHNIRINDAVIKDMRGSATGKILDWKNQEQASRDFGDQRFEVIVAADSMYDNDHPRLVAAMIAKYLKTGRTPAALVAVPMRDETTKNMYEEFVRIMREHNLLLRQQGGEMFKDDWGGANNDGVICWWSIWGWSGPWPYS